MGKQAAVSGVKTPRGSIIKKCTCVHDYQDAKCKEGYRVMNVNARGAACTVCGTQHNT